MRRLLIVLLSVFVFAGCATAPAEVTYNYAYHIYLTQYGGAKIGNIEVLLETHRTSSDSLTTDSESTPTVSPTLSVPWGGP